MPLVIRAWDGARALAARPSLPCGAGRCNIMRRAPLSKDRPDSRRPEDTDADGGAYRRFPVGPLVAGAWSAPGKARSVKSAARVERRKARLNQEPAPELVGASCIAAFPGGRTLARLIGA